MPSLSSAKVTLFGAVGVVSVGAMCIGWFLRDRSSRKSDLELRESSDKVETRLNGELLSIKKQLRIVEEDLRVAQRERSETQTENGTLRKRTVDYDRAVKTLEREITSLNERLRQTQQLLGQRTSELQSAQVFLTKADNLADSEVINLIEALNSEIYQIAAGASDFFDFANADILEEETIAAEVQDARDQTAVLFGLKFVQVLESFAHVDNPIVLQTAFQMCLAESSLSVASSWSLTDDVLNGKLSDAYSRMRSSEPQAIVGRWRSLARTHLSNPLPPSEHISFELVNRFVNILLAAGYPSSAESLRARVNERLPSRLGAVIKAATALRKAIGQEITSCDMIIAYPRPGTTYDSAIMADDFQEAEPTSKDPILGTVTLGLVKDPGPLSTNSAQIILLKPKIVLSTSL